MSGELYPNIQFIVVREKEGGKFVRAFLTDKNLKESGFFNSDLYTFGVELSHEPDEDGSILHIYPPIKEGV